VIFAIKAEVSDLRLWIPGGARLAFNPVIHVTRNTPPTFLLQAETDSVDNVNQSLGVLHRTEGRRRPTRDASVR